jgi:hypothetical protein
MGATLPSRADQAEGKSVDRGVAKPRLVGILKDAMDLNTLRPKLQPRPSGKRAPLRHRAGSTRVESKLGKQLAATRSRRNDPARRRIRAASKPHIALPQQHRAGEDVPARAGDRGAQEALPRRRGARPATAEGGEGGAFLVAGGQGTRLGYDGPKGEYPVTPIKSKPLFQVFAEQLLAHSRDAGRRSLVHHDQRRQRRRHPRFFKKNAYFGYAPSDVFFFQQGMMPAFAMDGRMLLESKDQPGVVAGRPRRQPPRPRPHGALADMRKRGVEHLSYFQVDNPLVYCIHPLFLGLHDLTGSEMSSKTVPRPGRWRRSATSSSATARCR